MRYIVTIRKPDSPVCYYLSKRGLRCFTAKNVALFRTLENAQSERDHFAQNMREFILTVERLPANVRNVDRAVLSAQPV